MKLLALTACLLFFSPTINAQSLTLALLVKSRDDQNFVEAHKGCQDEAELSGNSCIMIGPTGPASARGQVYALNAELEKTKIDALAISVIHSDLLAKHLIKLNLPIFSFDSPFTPEHEYLSNSYVGVDNHKYGKHLSRLALNLGSIAGTVCIMSAAHDSNLAERVQGIRVALSGNPDWPLAQRLAGEKGWTEMPRCPWDSGDSIPRSIRQLKTTLKDLKPNLFISVGHWPVVDSELYRKKLSEIKIHNTNTTVVVATGTLKPDQLNLLNEGLIDGFVSSNFHEIGRTIARHMTLFLIHNTSPQNTYIDTQSHTAEPN